MRLHDLDPAFVARLENWGAYWRDREYRPNVSPTHRVCEQLAIAAGKRIVDSYGESNPRPEFDVEDAMIMQRHWAMCGHRVSAQDRALISAYWTSNADPRTVCRVLKIRYLSWEKLLCEAVEKFRTAVEIMESCNISEHAR